MLCLNGKLMITETQITNDLIIEMKIPASQRYESTKQQEAYVARSVKTCGAITWHRIIRWT